MPTDEERASYVKNLEKVLTERTEQLRQAMNRINELEKQLKEKAPPQG